MKKLIIFPLIITLCFCSCKTDYAEMETRAIVSAIGIDKTDDALSVTMELVNPNAEEKNAENQIITKKGANFEDAISSISGSVSKNLFYSHCAVIVLGEKLTAKDIQSVFKFCFLSNEFTLLLKVIATKSAEELLSVKPKNEDVLGYEIMSVLNSRQKNLSIGYNNSFINVGGRRDVSPTLYALPYFVTEGKGKEMLYSLLGLKLYKNDNEGVILENNEAAVFEVLSNSFKSGQLNLKIGSNTTLVEIKNSSTKIKADLKDNRLKIALNLEQTVKNRSGSINMTEYKNALNMTENRLALLSRKEDLDVFYIKEYLKKEQPEIYNNTADNFEELYKNAEISFTANIKEES